MSAILRTTAALLAALAAGATINPAQTVLAAHGTVSLGKLPARVALEPTAGQPGGTLALWLRKLPPGRKIYLVLRDLRASAPPGVLFHVYLDLPEGVKPGKDDAHYVGSFNLFNEVRAEGPAANDSTADSKSDSKRASFRSYDITELGRKLESQRLLSEPTTISIQATHPPAEGSKPVIGRIELVEQ
jgi:hypothetical protein